MDSGLEHLFSLESMGIKTTRQDCVTLKRTNRKFEDRISFNDGHYTVELPQYPDKTDSFLLILLP